MIEALVLKAYRPSDCAKMAAFFYETVHQVCSADYTQAQLDAWADGQIDLDRWDRSFQMHNTVVAWKTGRIVGFGDSTVDAYLDRLYVHHDYQRQGIAAAICERMESLSEVGQMYAYASVNALSFL